MYKAKNSEKLLKGLSRNVVEFVETKNLKKEKFIKKEEKNDKEEK